MSFFDGTEFGPLLVSGGNLVHLTASSPKGWNSNDRLLRAANNSPWMERGEKDAVAVTILQQAINEIGAVRAGFGTVSVTGVFDDATANWVRNFKSKHPKEITFLDARVGKWTLLKMDKYLNEGDPRKPSSLPDLMKFPLPSGFPGNLPPGDPNFPWPHGSNVWQF
ncbi:MAG: hypothetical protein HY040_22705 [Planctomycetes bacterium]|nr:hypothetical protein [Planctomycetota bacterium]